MEKKTIYFNEPEIKPFQFAGRKDISKLVLGKNVKKIGRFAFFGTNKNLETIDCESIPEITDGFKEDCPNVVVQTTQQNIEAFQSDKRWTDFEIEESDKEVIEVPDPEIVPNPNLEELSPELFTYVEENNHVIVTGLVNKDIEIPNLVLPSKINNKPVTQIRIGYAFGDIMVNNLGMFENCRCRYIKIPDTVELITGHAFWNINSLERIDLPSTSPKYYDECYDTQFSNGLDRDYATGSVFRECDGLKKVIIPEGWKRIPNYYFASCRNLEEVVIPDSVEYIGAGAFVNCDKLSKFNIPENLKSYEGFLSQGNLEKQFTELTFPESCTSVKEHAFAYIYLNKLTFKGRVTIGDSAFRDGQFIDLILEKGASNALSLTNSDFRYSKCGTLYVPANELNNYKHLTCFKEIRALKTPEEELEPIPCEKLEIKCSKSLTYKVPGSTGNVERFALDQGETISFNIKTIPYNSTDKIIIESDKPEYVQVNSDGTVTALKYTNFNYYDDPKHVWGKISYANLTIKCGNWSKTFRVSVELPQ